MSKDNYNTIIKKPVVLIVTGPCGSGKTTITDLIVQNQNFTRICGDDIKDELFPGVVKIDEFPKDLEKVYQEIFCRAKKHFSNGENVVIDYVILGKHRIDDYQRTFSKNLIIRVLLSSKEVIIKRDLLRECWTSGEKCVNTLYDSFNKLKDYIGIDNYIDSSEDTPEETYMKYFHNLIEVN